MLTNLNFTGVCDACIPTLLQVQRSAIAHYCVERSSPRQFFWRVASQYLRHQGRQVHINNRQTLDASWSVVIPTEIRMKPSLDRSKLNSRISEAKCFKSSETPADRDSMRFNTNLHSNTPLFLGRSLSAMPPARARNRFKQSGNPDRPDDQIPTSNSLAAKLDRNDYTVIQVPVARKATNNRGAIVRGLSPAI